MTEQFLILIFIAFIWVGAKEDGCCQCWSRLRAFLRPRS